MRNRLNNQIGRSSRERRGAVVLEFLIVFPMIALATLAVLQFTLLMMANQTGSTAAIEGCRHATQLNHYGGVVFDDGDPDPDDRDDLADLIALRVERFLRAHRLEVEPTNSTDNQSALPDALVIIQRCLPGQSTETALRGNLSLQHPPPQGGLIANEVRVTVRFQLTNSATGSGGTSSPQLEIPVPNWLGPFGFSFTGRRFDGSARSLIE